MATGEPRHASGAAPRWAVAVALVAAAWGASAAEEAEPRIRVRLSAGPDAATITCRGGLRVVDRDTGKPVGPDPFGDRATLVGEPGERGAPVYRAQVASLSSEEQARQMADDLAARLGVPAAVAYHPDRGAWRVRVGQGRRPADLDRLVERLRDLGHAEVWVVEDLPVAARGTLRAVDAGWHDYLVPGARVRVLPVRRGARLAVGEGSYRGSIDVHLDRRGDLALVNELPMEDYLRGVVPNELGPALYPEMEALKAQAVAARTYAWRNRGQFAEDGYDLCDTPRCQVYRGAGSEHPMTDRAVRETTGLVATYRGEPIHALYSSTCGGHTEDGFRQFPEETGPYLRGVPCYPEATAAHARAWDIRGDEPGEPLLDGYGSRLDRPAALLASHGVLDPRGWGPAGVRRRASAAEIESWTGALAEALGKGAGGIPAVEDRDGLTQGLVTRLGWEDRVRVKVDEADLDYLLDFPDGDGIPATHRGAWALLLKDRVMMPFPDGTLRPRARPSRAELVQALDAVLQFYGATGLQSGTLLAVRGDRLRIETTAGQLEVRATSSTRLFKVLRGEAYPAARLQALTGDKVALRATAGPDGVAVADYLEVRSTQRSASDDRFTSVFEWEERVSRDDLASRLADHVRGIGELRDLEPLERGVSGRITALRVIGSEGSQVVRGFPIRTALGIRESLVAIDRQRGSGGEVVAFLFSGRGWGHGVGMCQVGAYGMALRGADFRQILQHYYTGISLKQAYVPGAAGEGQPDPSPGGF